MENLFEGLQEYGGSWMVKESRKFNDKEKSLCSHAVVTQSEVGQREGYGLSVCFFMKNGRTTYKPLSTHSKLGVGDSIDLETANILTLERDGETCQKIQEA